MSPALIRATINNLNYNNDFQTFIYTSPFHTEPRHFDRTRATSTGGIYYTQTDAKPGPPMDLGPWHIFADTAQHKIGTKVRSV